MTHHCETRHAAPDAGKSPCPAIFLARPAAGKPSCAQRAPFHPTTCLDHERAETPHCRDPSPIHVAGARHLCRGQLGGVPGRPRPGGRRRVAGVGTGHGSGAHHHRAAHRGGDRVRAGRPAGARAPGRGRARGSRHRPYAVPGRAAVRGRIHRGAASGCDAGADRPAGALTDLASLAPRGRGRVRAARPGCDRLGGPARARHRTDGLPRRRRCARPEHPHRHRRFRCPRRGPDAGGCRHGGVPHRLRALHARPAGGADRNPRSVAAHAASRCRAARSRARARDRAACRYRCVHHG